MNGAIRNGGVFIKFQFFTEIYGTFRFWLKPHKNDIHITWQTTRVYDVAL